jgi:hypothetical protein
VADSSSTVDAWTGSSNSSPPTHVTSFVSAVGRAPRGQLQPLSLAHRRTDSSSALMPGRMLADSALASGAQAAAQPSKQPSPQFGSRQLDEADFVRHAMNSNTRVRLYRQQQQHQSYQPHRSAAVASALLLGAGTSPALGSLPGLCLFVPASSCIDYVCRVHLTEGESISPQKPSRNEAVQATPPSKTLTGADSSASDSSARPPLAPLNGVVRRSGGGSGSGSGGKQRGRRLRRHSVDAALYSPSKQRVV